MKRWLANPRNKQRFGLLLILLAGLVVILAAWFRDGRTAAEPRNWTHLLIVVAIFLATAGAIFEIIASASFSDFMPEIAARRARILAAVGLLLFIPSCAWLGWFSTGAGKWASMVSGGLLIIGFGLSLAGIASLLLVSGSGYAGSRIERILDQEEDR